MNRLQNDAFKNYSISVYCCKNPPPPREKLDLYTGSARTSSESRSGRAILRREQRERLESNNRENLELAGLHIQIHRKRSGDTHYSLKEGAV
jgi:hypothetical protein